MRPIKPTFTPAILEELRYQRTHYPHPRVQEKMHVVYMKGKDVSTSEIARIEGLSLTTIRTYLKSYEQGGIDALKSFCPRPPSGELYGHQETLEQRFAERPPATFKEAAAHIQEWTGLERSPKQAGEFLKRIGFKRRKTGQIPAKANPDKQEQFRQTELEPRLEEAKANKRKVLFMDGAHFVWGPFLGFLWCLTRVFVSAPAGRSRYSVLGALDAITHQLHMIGTDAYINSSTVVQLLKQIKETLGDIAITIVLDNAAYQRCHYVRDQAKELGIELLFLPTYSPNLNLIERLWKFVKADALQSNYHASFALFKASIQNTLSETTGKHKKRMDSLLTLKFQKMKSSAA